MKKIINIMLFLICFCLLTISCVPYVNADGGMIMYKMDRWEMLDEDQQLCAINYHEGIQNMILSVNTGEEITGEKAVWIFPVPAKPEKTVINIVEGFPELNGYDVESKAENSVSDIFGFIRVSQIYTLPLFIFTGSIGKGSFNSLEMYAGEIDGIKGVTVHESIEKSGLTTELISALDSNSFSNYLISKDLDVPPNFKSILNDYIGEEYSFVVSWISDVEKFKLEQPEGYIIGLLEEGKIDEARKLFDGLDYESENYGYDSKKYGYYYYLNEIFEYIDKGRNIEEYQIEELKRNRGTGNILSVFISFPTDKIYYPLKPTSVYGSKKVPAIIYVMDYVKPELYPEIKAYSDVDYFFRENFDVPENLNDFFGGSDTKDLKYTKIKINPPSKYLTEDLWIERKVPLKVFLADSVNRFPFWFGLFFFVICSCLASLLSGIIIFGVKGVSKIKFMLFGLWNFLTLIGFSIAAYTNKIDVKFTKLQEIQQSKIPFGKAFITTLLISAISPMLFLLLFLFTSGSFRHWYSNVILPMIIIYAFTIILFAPFVSGYYKNKRIIKFVILFTILFTILTVIFDYLLKLMFV